MRYDDYSDFGSTTNPKLSFRYTPVEQLLLRGSYNTGFAAPTLEQLVPAELDDVYGEPLQRPGAVPGRCSRSPEARAEPGLRPPVPAAAGRQRPP